MLFVKNRATGELAAADTALQAKMLCLQGHRPLTDDELAELNREAPQGEAPIATASTAEPTPPPKTGPGSGKEQWHIYAAAHDVDVAPDAPKDDVIAALTERGIRTE